MVINSTVTPRCATLLYFCNLYPFYHTQSTPTQPLTFWSSVSQACQIRRLLSEETYTPVLCRTYSHLFVRIDEIETFFFSSLLHKVCPVLPTHLDVSGHKRWGVCHTHFEIVFKTPHMTHPPTMTIHASNLNQIQFVGVFAPSHLWLKQYVISCFIMCLMADKTASFLELLESDKRSWWGLHWPLGWMAVPVASCQH